jgi:hypothetical protein
LDDARRLAEGATGRAAGAAPSREFALALIEIFEGKDDAAKARLEPRRRRAGDAALELGLLELRHGRRDAARRWLDPIVNNRSSTARTIIVRAGGAARQRTAACERRLFADQSFAATDIQAGLLPGAPPR